MPRPAGAQDVEAHPRDDRREPSVEVLDAARAGAAESQPCFLDGVVGLVRRAEHPIGHKPAGGSVSPRWEVEDIEESLKLLIGAGAETQQAVTDVGGGKLIAAVKDADGNVTGLVQSP